MSGHILDAVKKFSIIWTVDCKWHLRPECRPDILDPLWGDVLTYDHTHVPQSMGSRDTICHTSSSWARETSMSHKNHVPTRIILDLVASRLKSPSTSDYEM
jgi:hypothetical protein